MSDLHELALVALPIESTIKDKISDADKIIATETATTNRELARSAIAKYKGITNSEEILTQAKIDSRGKNFTPEREITYRLKRLGV